jgi:hypothetical protein
LVAIGNNTSGGIAELEFSDDAATRRQGLVSQPIELFDYDADEWEVVDTQNEIRVGDKVVEVAATGDLCIEARIRFTSTNPRRRFVSETDQFKWTIIP